MDVKNEILKTAHLLNLGEHLNKMSKNLSGGTKRRLSIAMALIGDPKVI